MEFDRYAKDYDSGFMGKGSRRFYADLVKELEIEDGDHVLDVGCGTGSVLSILGAQKRIKGYGLDVSPNMIDIAKDKNPQYDFVTGDCAALPYEDGSMDVIMACMAYHHFPDQAGFRKEVLRVLKPGGRLYISDPRFPGIVRLFFNSFFKDAGFRSGKRNSEDFRNSGFVVNKISKDLYVQVVTLEKAVSAPADRIELVEVI